MTVNLIKIKTPRPQIHFNSFYDAVEDADNGIIYPLDQCGYEVRQQISTIVDRWNLRPVDEYQNETMTKSKARSVRHLRSKEWLAYEAVLVTNRWHPEDIVTLHRYLSTAFDEAATRTINAIKELEKIAKREQVDKAQCNRLVGFLKDNAKQMQEDRVWCLTRLLDLILELQGKPELWAEAGEVS